jgi:hypothetical protein
MLLFLFFLKPFQIMIGLFFVLNKPIFGDLIPLGQNRFSLLLIFFFFFFFQTNLFWGLIPLKKKYCSLEPYSTWGP